MNTALDIEDHDALLDYLRARGHIAPDETPAIRNLSGGVSNRTVLVERDDSAGESWVIKQSLPYLRVETEWYCDPERIFREALGAKWLSQLTPPGSVPAPAFEDHDNYLFAMAAVPQPHENWKRMLLRGEVESRHVVQFAELLAMIHRGGFERWTELKPIFGDQSIFEVLRIDPYYSYTATILPECEPFLSALIEDTRAANLTLAHGDFSPKNILVHLDRLILLDHEVVHFGDPAFDLGFSMSHLLSKAHHVATKRGAFADTARLYWKSYTEKLGAVPWRSDLERRAARHALGCLLARIDGKSPLEYLSETERDRQRRAVVSLMAGPPDNFNDLINGFTAMLDH